MPEQTQPQQPENEKGQEIPPDSVATPENPAETQSTVPYMGVGKWTEEQKKRLLGHLRDILDYQKQAGLEDTGIPRNS
jgi:hypothetical protein